MDSLNQVTLLGTVGTDPEVTMIRPIGGRGTATAARFPLIVARTGMGSDRLSIVAFGEVAQFAASFLESGATVLVMGRLHQDETGVSVTAYSLQALSEWSEATEIALRLEADFTRTSQKQQEMRQRLTRIKSREAL